jgi:hydroxymethylpyrimidine/phosphomethylpyrimidine kinase
MRVKLTAEQKKVVAETMKEAKKYRGSERESFIAKTIGDVYDVELPIPEVISAIARTERAEVGEHVYFLAPTTITKKVNTITSDCEVTQVKVTPNTQTEVTWADLVSEDVYVCLHDWLKADHDVLTFNADAIQEAMDRQEIYSVLQLADAGAVNESNVYTLDSGKTTFDYPKLVEMARSIAKYGRELVLITGGNITTGCFIGCCC